MKNPSALMRLSPPGGADGVPVHNIKRVGNKDFLYNQLVPLWLNEPTIFTVIVIKCFFAHKNSPCLFETCV